MDGPSPGGRSVQLIAFLLSPALQVAGGLLERADGFEDADELAFVVDRVAVAGEVR
jgi:hypothetical protein